jgi:hypothetical protein
MQAAAGSRCSERISGTSRWSARTNAAKQQYDRELDQTWGQWLAAKMNAPALLERTASHGQ